MGAYKLKKKIRENELTPVILDLGVVKEDGWNKSKKDNLLVNKEESK